MTQGKKIPAIVLAAGMSRRFGSENKLEAKIKRISILEKTIANLSLSQCGKIFVVVGHNEASIKKLLKKFGVTFLMNRNFRSGMGSSIGEGIKSLPENAPGALIVLGDMPLVKPETIDRLLRAHKEAEGKKILVPVFNSQRGNPVLWDREVFSNLLGLTQDAGGREIFRKNPGMVKEVPVDDPGILFDVDVAEDLACFPG